MVAPTPLQLWANSITLPDNVLHLQEEMNDAMVHLLTLKASIDAFWQKLISEMEITHCLNEIKTSEAIREIKAHYMAALSNAKATYAAAIREAEATLSASAREAEVICNIAVRKAEAASVAQTSKLQQIHQETIQTLEDKAIEEEKCAHQSFLWACGAALQACPNEALGYLCTPYNREYALTGLLTATLQLTIRSRDPIPSPSHHRRSATYTHSTRTKQQHLLGCEVELDPSGYGEPISCPGEPSQQRQKEEDPLVECLRGAHQEAFCKDSVLVKCTGQTYFRAHWPVFDREVTHDLTNVFKELAEMAGLMDTEIHWVQDQCQG